MDITSIDINKLEIKAKCTCNTETTVNSGGVKLKDIVVNGSKYMITYLSCSKCYNDLVLQVDNDETKKILNECKKILRSKIKAKKKRKHFSDSKNERLAILQNMLKEKRLILAYNINGKEYYDTEQKVTKDSVNCSFILDCKSEV